MRTILFLDDDHARISAFRGIIERVDCHLSIVETAEDCISELNRTAFDLVLLDHDLGGEIFVDSEREDCGMEVVRWLKTNGGEHGSFIVHTMNPVAATAMYFELQTMGYRVEQAPFGSSRFYAMLSDMLGHRIGGTRRRSIGERFTEYVRSIRFK